MKKVHKKSRAVEKPQFDSEGYQINISEINGAKLPDLSKLKVISREKAGLPEAAKFRRVLAQIQPEVPSSYVKAREKSGLTQEKFAATIGVKVSTYRQWEQGRRVPTGPAVTLLKLLSSHPRLIADLQKSVAA